MSELAPEVVEWMPGIWVRTDGKRNKVTDKRGWLYVLGHLWDRLEEPPAESAPTVDLLPRQYIAEDGTVYTFTPGHRLFLVWETIDDRLTLQYEIEVIEPQSPSCKPKLETLREACREAGIDVDGIERSRIKLCDALTLRRWTDDFLASLSASRAARRDVKNNWPAGKENVTWEDQVRGPGARDWVEIHVTAFRGLA